MKTEGELLDKLELMVINRDRLKTFLDNPPENAKLSEIEKNIIFYSEQCHYIDLMEWVLN